MKILTLIFVVFAGGALAQQGPMQALRAASAQIEAATAALAETGAAEDRVIALSAAIRGLEEGLAALRLALRASRSEAGEMRAELQARRGELGQLLATLATMQDMPPALTVLHPDGPLAAARAASMLGAITPALRRKAERLGADLAEIAALESLHDEALANAQAAIEGLQAARASLTLAIREADPEKPVVPDPPAYLDRLARTSRDLSTLAARLEAQIPQAARMQGDASLKGRLPYPLAGTLSRRFNAPNGAGIPQPGIVITAPPLSLVLAPQAGIVRFTGEFLEYGQVVILEPAPDLLQIYAGFGQVYVKTGEVLESGAAMGLLGGEMPDSAEFLAESGSENDKGAESLYIEIRENGIPVDPEQWFTTN